VVLAWDCELAFGDGNWNRDIWCYDGWAPLIRQFQQFQGHEHHFLNQVHEYLAKYFNHTYMDPWIDYYYSRIGGHNPSNFKTFIDNRRGYVQARIPSASVNITTPGPLDVPGPTAALSGTAPVNASWVRSNGRVYWLEWTDATHWYVTIDVPGGTNNVTLEFLDYDRQLIGTDSIMITAPGSSEIEQWQRY
jgi:hypothetical protein